MIILTKTSKTCLEQAQCFSQKTKTETDNKCNIRRKNKTRIKVKINQNLAGEEKKKLITSRNTETFRLIVRVAAFGKNGVVFYD